MYVESTLILESVALNGNHTSLFPLRNTNYELNYFTGK